MVLEPMTNGDATFVLGCRQGPGRGKIESHRRIGRTFLDWVTNTAGNADVADTQSGFRALDASIVPTVLPDQDGYAAESEMLIKASDAGIEISEVTIAENYPDEVSPNTNPVVHATEVLYNVFHLVRSKHPFAFFGTAGLLLLILGGVYGYDTTTHYYATREFWPGKAMLSVLCSILGTQLIVAGMILDYLSKWIDD
jgi:hypothetical protein